MLREPLRDLTDQPSARALEYLRAAAALRTVVRWALALVLGVAIALIAGGASNWALEIIVGALGLLLLSMIWFAGVLPTLVVRFYRHEIHDDAVLIQRGFFTRRHAVVPFARVQSVSMNRGFVERRFGLGTVVLQTAAGNESIPMLDDGVADELRVRLTERARWSIDDI